MICRIAETLNNDNAKRHHKNGNSLCKSARTRPNKNGHHHHYYYCKWLNTLNWMCVHFNEMVESSCIGSKLFHSKQTHSVWKCVRLWINISWWSRKYQENSHRCLGGRAWDKIYLKLFLSLVRETKDGIAVKVRRMGSLDTCRKVTKYTEASANFEQVNAMWKVMLATEQPMHKCVRCVCRKKINENNKKKREKILLLFIVAVRFVRA